jgi:pyruvate ferredoxin oxidoreductase gamma subunit
VTAGLKDDGLVVVNTSKGKKELAAEFNITARLATVNADKIANEEIGRPITNTTMMGALVRATGLVELDSLAKQIEKRFPGVAEKNIKAMHRAYEETEV